MSIRRKREAKAQPPQFHSDIDYSHLASADGLVCLFTTDYFSQEHSWFSSEDMAIVQRLSRRYAEQAFVESDFEHFREVAMYDRVHLRHAFFEQLSDSEISTAGLSRVRLLLGPILDHSYSQNDFEEIAYAATEVIEKEPVENHRSDLGNAIRVLKNIDFIAAAKEYDEGEFAGVDEDWPKDNPGYVPRYHALSDWDKKVLPPLWLAVRKALADIMHFVCVSQWVRDWRALLSEIQYVAFRQCLLEKMPCLYYATESSDLGLLLDYSVTIDVPAQPLWTVMTEQLLLDSLNAR